MLVSYSSFHAAEVIIFFHVLLVNQHFRITMEEISLIQVDLVVLKFISAQ